MNEAQVSADSLSAQPRTSNVGVVTVKTDKLASIYANVCLANSTRDEVVLSFGLNQDWDRSASERAIAMLKRIILTPQGAKRFGQRLEQVLAEYQKRHGEIDIQQP